MTFSALNIVRVAYVRAGIPIDPSAPWLPTFDRWPPLAQRAYLVLVHSYAQHATELLIACCFYYLMWPAVMPFASTLSPGWIAAVVAVNLALEVATYGAWHGAMYAGRAARGPLAAFKYNHANQYEPDPAVPVGWLASSTGHLQREVALTTCGWLQAAAWQVAVMHAFATGALPAPPTVYWSRPLVALAWIAGCSWWRDLHFYAIHRMMHPWTRAGARGRPPWWDGGAWLYRTVHALHHASYNPGPWAGLAMHPVEHAIYFSCVLAPLALRAHPLAFWYVMAHALVSPLGGHDGFAKPGGGGGAHYLHHAHMEVNYGVSTATPVDLDGLFGTSVSWEDYVAAGRNFSRAKELAAARRRRPSSSPQ